MEQGKLESLMATIQDRHMGAEELVEFVAACIHHTLLVIQSSAHAGCPIGVQSFNALVRQIQEMLSTPDKGLALWLYNKLYDVMRRSWVTSRRIVPHKHWCDFVRRFFRCIIDGTEPVIEKALAGQGLSADHRQLVQDDHNIMVAAAWLHIASGTSRILLSCAPSVSQVVRDAEADWPRYLQQYLAEDLDQSR